MASSVRSIDCPESFAAPVATSAVRRNDVCVRCAQVTGRVVALLRALPGDALTVGAAQTHSSGSALSRKALAAAARCRL